MISSSPLLHTFVLELIKQRKRTPTPVTTMDKVISKQLKDKIRQATFRGGAAVSDRWCATCMVYVMCFLFVMLLSCLSSKGE